MASLSPTINIAGSFFPAWMICIIVGIVLALTARLVAVKVRLDGYFQPPIAAYGAMMILFTLITWLVLFKN